MELAPSSRTIRTLLASDIPLIDVRAPAEFSQGAMPASHNLPLMNDEERAAVGTCYKQQGAEKALALGYQLVSGTRREQRTAAWLTACAAYPQGYLCCARGGQRSHIVQQWLRDAGTEYPLITGGYKALRQSVIQVTEELLDRPVLLIGGCTGSGKTTLVGELADGIDLEGLAHHRGSSFGRTLEAQFAQATFENHLTAAMIKKEEISARWVLEDEGRAIGANGLPELLRAKMAQASLVVVEDPFERRLERLKDEYFDRMSRDFLAAYGEEKGREAYSEYLHHGLSAIRRRLGSQRAAELTALLGTALAEQWRSGNTEAHFSWLCPLLEEYYDPMYRYQLSKKADRILFRGTYDAVADWLK